MTDTFPPPRSPSWKWWVCVLLLLATMVNYMDRLTLNQLSVRIMEALSLDAAQYGQLESAFGFAFALGAITAGWLADRFSVRWLYAVSVVAWSAAGLCTGLSQGFLGLLVCRFALGFAEAGNWPCALRTTQAILPPDRRTTGNGILQSGAAFGAVLTPPLVLGLIALGEYAGIRETWRLPFVVVGAIGFGWAVLWLLSVRTADLPAPRGPKQPSLVAVLGVLLTLLAFDVGLRVAAARPEWVPWGLGESVASPQFLLAGKTAVCVLAVTAVTRWLLTVTADETSIPRGLFVRRFVVLMGLVTSINITWHFFRAWLPLFLMKQHGYTETEFGWFNMAYYFATDIGSLTAGFTATLLSRGGMSVHGGRVVVFGFCAVLTTLSVAAALLPGGPALLAVLLVIAFGALGLFPIYYTFSQELTTRHQGKVTGSLSCINWMVMYLLHEVVGESVKATGRYEVGVALAGLVPMVGFGVLLALWGRTPASAAHVQQ